MNKQIILGVTIMMLGIWIGSYVIGKADVGDWFIFPCACTMLLCFYSGLIICIKGID